MKRISDIYYGRVRDAARTLELTIPEGTGFPTIVFFHGGGLVKGDKLGHRRLAEAFAEQGIAFASANYRMYPDAKYPDFIEDAAEAVAWVKEHIGEWGGSGKLVVGGSSAGGYLSMMLCFDPQYLGVYGIKPTDVSAFLHDAGQPTVHFRVLAERGLDSRRIVVDEAAPLWHVGLSSELAPMLFIYSDQDMENRPEQTCLMRSTLGHFRLLSDSVEFSLQHGKHTHYTNAFDENGESRFVSITMPFLKKHL